MWARTTHKVLAYIPKVSGSTTWILYSQNKLPPNPAMLSGLVLMLSDSLLLRVSFVHQFLLQLCDLRERVLQSDAKPVATGNSSQVVTRASLLGARTLLGAPGLTTRNKKLLVTRALLVARSCRIQSPKLFWSQVQWSNRPRISSSSSRIFFFNALTVSSRAAIS